MSTRSQLTRSVSRHSPNRTIGLLLITGGLLLAVGAVVFEIRARHDEAISADRGLPNFVLTDDSGSVITRETLRGSRYLLLFSRSNCSYCKRAVKELDDALATLRGPLRLFVVKESPGALSDCRYATPVSSSDPWTAYGVSRVPALLLIDESSQVAARWVGYSSWGDPAKLLARVGTLHRPVRAQDRSAGCETCEKHQ